MSGEKDRLVRLLALVPYLQARGSAPLAEVATDFDVTPAQIQRDLELLWMCGLPGQGPGDLIDLSFEGDDVSVVFDAGIRRPARLTPPEALALTVALRTLAETPGLTDGAAVERALAKVEAAAGGGEVAGGSAVQIELDTEARVTPVVDQALATGRALELRYWTAARDETTDRVVDPLRRFELDGHAYLEAWCRRAEGMRTFRLDRVEAVDVLDEPARPPELAVTRDLAELDGGVYVPAPEHLLVTLEVGAGYAWVADYYRAGDVETRPDGTVRMSLRVSDPGWVRAMALGSAGQVRVLDPGWLAEQVVDEARAALARYGT
ncbi:helix-turn-helix transcriptional regulator [Jatrophihabitans sp. YIM 134969]